MVRIVHTPLTDKLNHDQWVRKNSPNVKKAAKFAKIIWVAPYNGDSLKNSAAIVL